MKSIGEMTAEEIGKAYREKTLTVPEVVKAFLDNIEKEDEKIKAYITVCKEEALKKADEVQAMFDAEKEMGALAGIPIAIKDNICTKGVRTTCASKMLENFIPPYDASVMKKIEEANAIILGKTNMDEFAMGGSTENSAFFITKNPLIGIIVNIISLIINSSILP